MSLLAATFNHSSCGISSESCDKVCLKQKKGKISQCGQFLYDPHGIP